VKRGVWGTRCGARSARYGVWGREIRVRGTGCRVRGA